MRDPIAIVPLKTTFTAKRRLAHVVGPRFREQLVSLLFRHVSGVLRRAGLEVVTVSSGQAPDADVEDWPDGSRGLNAGLHAALRRVAGPALVVPADLPWLEVADVHRLLDEPGHVVIARARDGGTNGLLLNRRVTPSFGPHSALAHAAAARAVGARARVVEIAGFYDDLDDESALVRACASSPALTGLRLQGWKTPGSEDPGVPTSRGA